MEYRRIKGVKHCVFDSHEEFSVYHDGKPPEVIDNWRKGEELDWVRSDDGRIVQLLKVSHKIRHPNDRKNYKWAGGWVRTVVGTFLLRDENLMDTDFERHKNRYSFSGRQRTWKQSVQDRTSNTSKEKIFITDIVVGMGPAKSYMDAFSEKDPDKARKKAVVLLEQERIMSEIEKSVLDVAKSLGIDHKYVLRKLKTVTDKDIDDIDPNLWLQSIKELGKAIGTTGGASVKQRELGVIGMFGGITQDMIEEAARPEEVAAESVSDNGGNDGSISVED